MRIYLNQISLPNRSLRTRFDRRIFRLAMHFMKGRSHAPSARAPGVVDRLDKARPEIDAVVASRLPSRPIFPGIFYRIALAGARMPRSTLNPPAGPGEIQRSRANLAAGAPELPAWARKLHRNGLDRPWIPR
jgi:hypothetical protein